MLHVEMTDQGCRVNFQQPCVKLTGERPPGTWVMFSVSHPGRAAAGPLVLVKAFLKSWSLRNPGPLTKNARRAVQDCTVIRSALAAPLEGRPDKQTAFIVSCQSVEKGRSL